MAIALCNRCHAKRYVVIIDHQNEVFGIIPLDAKSPVSRLEEEMTQSSILVMCDSLEDAEDAAQEMAPGFNRRSIWRKDTVEGEEEE